MMPESDVARRLCEAEAWVAELQVQEDTPRLSVKEARVLACLLNGQTTDVELADALGCSKSTATAHVRRLMALFGVRGRAALIAKTARLLLESRRCCRTLGG